MAATRPIRTLAVIGAGNMGSGIAQKAATEGFPVVLVDLDDAKVARGLSIIETTLAQGVERKIFWLTFVVLGVIADVVLPLWWGLAATIPIFFISWWVAYRSDWF